MLKCMAQCRYLACQCRLHRWPEHNLASIGSSIAPAVTQPGVSDTVRLLQVQERYKLHSVADISEI